MNKKLKRTKLNLWIGACCASLAIVGSSTANATTNTASELLSTYAELESQLATIGAEAIRPFEFGPLIKNGSNGGLIDIDSSLSLVSASSVNQDVCGVGTNPSLREAVTCTIEAGGRGNTDTSKIGKSTQGRDLLAARIGNPYGAKVMIITQQHGNEPAATESALQVLDKWSKRYYVGHRHPLKNLDILFVIRANPDGSEPTDQCASPLPVGAPNLNDCAFSRMNVDPSAGGGFLANTEPGFLGVVGQGYNLNRYHFVNLDNAIRPVEAQAMVAAALAFEPEYVLDLHSDAQKTDCDIDFSTITPNSVLGSFPSALCIGGGEVEDEVRRDFSVFAYGDPDTELGTKNRALAGQLLTRMEATAEGTVGRFSQVQAGAGTDNGGSASQAYQSIGAVSGGWETANFALEFRPDVVSFVDGIPTIAPNVEAVDAENMADQIKLNTKAIRKALRIISRFERKPHKALNDDAFCDFPLATGLLGTTPTTLFGPAGSDDPQLIPMSPQIGVPLAISGVCPQDL